MAKKPIKQAPIIVAIDDGYAAIKGRGFSIDGASIFDFRLPSNLVEGRHTSIDGTASNCAYSTHDDYYDDEITLTVTDTIVGQPVDFDGYHCSPQIRVLINHALAEAGYSGQKVDLWLALPVSDFYLPSGEKNEEFIQKKKEAITQAVISEGKRDLAKIVSVSIVPQAIVAIFNYITDDNGYEFDEHEEENTFCVVDIGGRTTDIGYMARTGESNQLSIDPSRSSSINGGVLEVRQLLMKLLKETFPTIKSDLSPRRLDQALKTKKITIGKEVYDISDLCKKASRPIARRIVSKMSRSLQGADIDTMLLVGGGAHIFMKDIQKSFPDVKITDDPETSNVRGIFKYAKRIREAQAG